MKVKKIINSAELVSYNANNRGNNVGDCVKRSMSLAFDIPYAQIGKLLNEKMKKSRYTAWNIYPVFSKVIADLGGGHYTTMPNPLTVDEYVEQEADPSKTYLLLVGKKFGSTSHLVCVRNGKIWDSWDCRDYYVTGYWVVPQSTKSITDLKEHLDELDADLFEPILEREIIKQMKKYKMDGEYAYNTKVKGYALTSACRLTLYAKGVIKKQRIYNFQINLSLEPTMSLDEAKSYIEKTTKIRAYDRIYAIEQEEKKVKEEWDMKSQAGLERTAYSTLQWMDAREKKFFSTLPGWARALITYVNIQEPGQYHDSYSIKMDKLPNDETHPNIKNFYLNAYEASQIRDMLDRYAKYGEIEGIDYSYDFY